MPDVTDYRLTWEDTYRRAYAAGQRHWRAALATPRAFAEFMASPDAPPRGAEIVEAGCGDGLNCICLARLGYVVTGVDIVRAAIDRARQTALAQDVPVTFLCLDLVREPLADGSACDLWVDIKMLHVLWEDADRQAYLAGALRTLRSGGLYFLNAGLALADVRKHFPDVFASLDPAAQAQADTPDRGLPRHQRRGIRCETLEWYCRELRDAGLVVRHAGLEASIEHGWGVIILAEKPGATSGQFSEGAGDGGSRAI